MNTVIELLGQSWPGNVLRMTYLWLENSRDLLWPSFYLEVYLVQGQKSELSVVESSLVKIETILS